ncbi:hypothetical protein LSH36_71g07041 [Paralvinella palmiformis]|uniref:Ig-like domain-containing protein n=1 Tax=Paralvinella palmiformis TaxID=53620 RepID=A0AAD9K3B7_9ANNE|nr:hypothetical protein LSH36_71g07041 [Paralvinella palmiformis]
MKILHIGVIVCLVGVFLVTCSPRNADNGIIQRLGSGRFRRATKGKAVAKKAKPVVTKKKITATKPAKNGTQNAKTGWMGGVLPLKVIQEIKKNIETHINTRRVGNGTTVKFDCSHDVSRLVFKKGFETVSTYWLHNNSTFARGKRRTADSYIAKIQGVQSSDNGVYTCNIKYPYEESRVIRLETLLVETDQVTKLVWDGGSMDLSCHSSTALPHLKGFWVRWIHNGTTYVERKSHVWLFDNLHIYPVNTATNGIWECQLANDLGKVWWTSRYVVKVLYPKLFSFNTYLVVIKDYFFAGINAAFVCFICLFSLCCLRKPEKRIHFGRSLYVYYDWRNSWRHGSSNVSLIGDDMDLKKLETALAETDLSEHKKLLIGGGGT